MENRPVISFIFHSPVPGADSEAYERARRWQVEVYFPMMKNIPGSVGVDDWQNLREHTEYPSAGGLAHFTNLTAGKDYAATPEGAAIIKDVNFGIERGVLDIIWSATYALIQSFRAKPVFSATNRDTRIESASIMHMEAYRLSLEEQEKYFKWFNEYGRIIFMPLFMKLPGVVGYDWYEDTGFRRRQARETDYPKYLSIAYFENINAYENFVKSPELAGFLKAMRSVFSHGLNYKWYVQYQLTKSLRK